MTILKDIKNYFNKELDNKSLFKEVFIYVLIFSVIANAYCWFDFAFSHDAAAMISDDVLFHVSIGRYLDSILYFFRGNLFSPFILGILSVIYLSISTYFITKIFDLRKRKSIILTSGILSANYIITLVSATYIHELDIYTFSLMLSVIGSYICIKYKKGWIPAIILFWISTTLYQSYFQLSVIILMFSLLKDIYDKVDYKKIINRSIKYLISLFLALVIYVIGIKVSLSLFNVEALNAYNGVVQLKSLLNIKSLIKYSIECYYYFFYGVTYLRIYNEFIMFILLTIASISTIIIMLIKLIKDKYKMIESLLFLLILFLIPLGGNIIYVITSGMEHYLMMYSFLIVYIFFLYIAENIEFKSKTLKQIKILFNIFIVIVSGLLIFNSVIYSNGSYMKKHVEYEETYATLNRIISRIEQLDGYEVNKTKVVFVGNLERSNLLNKKDYFDYYGTGLEYSFAVTHPESFYKFINNVMNYPMNVIIDRNVIDEYSQKEEVKEMDYFPYKESIKMIDGVVVVKLSEPVKDNDIV